jgi:hypothetical protein
MHYQTMHYQTVQYQTSACQKALPLSCHLVY